jgi:hypothetical protein
VAIPAGIEQGIRQTSNQKTRSSSNPPFHADPYAHRPFSPLILFSDTDQPLAPLFLSHLPEQPFPLVHTLGHGFFLGRTTNPNLDLSRLEIRRADGRESFDGELDDGCTVERGRAGLSLPAFLQLRGV